MMKTRAFILLFFLFAAGCTVQLYPPVKKVEPLPPAQVEPVSVTPDGGMVIVNGDGIPQSYSGRKRFYWEQIEQSDSTQSFAVTNGAKDGRWIRGDSMRWHPNGPFVTIGADTVATRAYARDSGGSGGVMTSFDLSADNGANETITDGETLAIQAYNPFNLINSGIQTYTTSNGVEIGWFPAAMDTAAVFESTDYLVISKPSGKPYVFGYDLLNEVIQDEIGAMVTGNTETLITVTYDDANNQFDFVVESNLSNYTNDAGFLTSFDWGSDSGNTSITDGETIRVLGSTNGIDVTGTGNDKTVDLDFLELGAGIGVSTTDDYFIAVSSVGTEKRYQGEEVKDWIGAMVSGNTESGITVTYQAADQTFDFSATDNSATNEAWDIAGDTGSETQITAADGTITFAGGTGISTAYNSTTNTLTISSTGGSGMTSWTWGGDVATTSITDGETVRVQADAGLDAILSGNTVTVSYDFNELSSVGSTPSALDKVLLYDFSTSSYRQMAASGFVSPILEAAGEIRFDNRPSDPTGDQGDVFYDTDDDQLKLYTASGWKLIPIQENEEWGNTGSTTTSASGTVTVSHSLGVSPSYVNAIINPATTGWYTMVSTVTSSNVVFRVTDASGVSCASCSVTLYYHFKK